MYKGQIQWSLENPASSRLWSWPPLQAFLSSNVVFKVRVDYCCWGCRYLKPTVLYTSSEDLLALGSRCQGGHLHEHLQGTVRQDGKTYWKTSLAGRYPPSLCRRWAQIVGSIAPRSAWAGDAGLLVRRDWEDQMAFASGHVISSYSAQPSCPKGDKPEWTLDEVS